MGSVLKCTDFCLFNRGRGVLTLVIVAKLYLMDLNFVLIQSNSQVADFGGYSGFPCYLWWFV